MALVGSFTEAGTTAIGVREYSVLSGEERDRFMRNLLGLRLALTMTGGLVAIGFALAAGYDATMVFGAALGCLALLGLVLQSSYAIPLQAGLRWNWFTAIDTAKTFVTVVLIITFVLASAGLVAFFTVPVPVALIALAGTFALTRRLMPGLPRIERAQWRDLLRVTLPFALASALGALYIYTSVILMSLVSTRQQAGYFGASVRLIAVVGVISPLLVSSAFPVMARAARDDHQRLAYALQRLFDSSLVLGGLVTLVTVLGAPFAFTVLAAHSFTPSIDVLRIQAFSLIGTYLLALWGYALLSLHRYRALLTANGLALIVSAATTLGLAPSYGARGAAVATVAGESTLALAYAVFLMRANPELRVSLRMAPRIAAAAGVAALVVLVPHLSSFVETLLASVIFITLAIAFGAMPDELWDALPRRHPRVPGGDGE